MKKLSIVILNYNTKDLLVNCLNSLYKVKDEVDFETIVIDNASIDESVNTLSEKFKWVKLVKSNVNLGFAKGNNLAKNIVSGEYVLFLNSDTEVYPNTLKETLNFIKNDSQIGAVSAKILLPDGTLDKDTRRSFPTPWVSLTHFSGLDRKFSTSRIFAKYWYGYLSENEIHEVDVLQGAFFLTRKKILDEVGWFSTDYFLDGEDIDLCWKIKSKGYKLFYYPLVSILHIKGASKGKKIGFNKSLTKEERRRIVGSGVNSMEIFYKKRMWKKYPFFINWLVILGINIIKLTRILSV